MKKIRYNSAICFLLFIQMSWAQTGLLQTRVSLKRDHLSLEKALAALEEATGCNFIYSPDLMNIDRTVRLNYSNAPLQTILHDLLGDAVKNIEVKGNQINLQPSAGKGSIIGYVRSRDGQPAAYVTVGIKGAKSTQADEQGHFLLEKVEAGQQLLSASFVGLQTQRKQVYVKAGETVSVDFMMQEDAQTLQEVVIHGIKVNKFGTEDSPYPAKLPLSYLENPQVYSTLSKELFSEQLTTDLSDALKNTAGIVKMQGSVGRSDDGAIYYNLRGFPTRISMIDGVPGQTNGEIDPANIERIETIKGPSATLYGGALTSFGGLINVVTKKPIDTLGGEIAYSLGSYNLSRLSADIYGPLSKNQKFTARFNASHQNRNSFQDFGFKKSTLIAPSMAYQVNDRLNFELSAAYYDYEGTNTPIVFLSRTRQFFARQPSELGFNWNNSYSSNDLTLRAPASNIRAQANYRMNNQWTSNTYFSHNYRKTDGIYQYQFVRGNESDQALERNVQLQDAGGSTISVQQNFTGDFHIGTLRNRLVMGVDYVNQAADVANSAIVKFDTINGTLYDKKYLSLNRLSAENKIRASTAAPVSTHSSSNIYSLYFSDVLNITPQLLAMASLRIDRFDSRGTFNKYVNEQVENSAYKQTAWSPKFGLVYQLWDQKISLFANYMNGFSYEPPVTQPLPDISGSFKPQQANQAEGGIKMNLLQHRLNITASYYDIRVKDIIRDVTIERDGEEYSIAIQDGSQTSKGFETELSFNPISSINLLAGYSHNDSKLTRADANVEGRRPASAGPADVFNAWASYRHASGKLEGLGIGFGINYVGEHVMASTVTTGEFIFPSYTLLNATAFFDRPRYRIGLKFDNIGDKTYFAGQGVISPQLGGSFTANVSFRF